MAGSKNPAATRAGRSLARQRWKKEKPDPEYFKRIGSKPRRKKRGKKS